MKYKFDQNIRLLPLFDIKLKLFFRLKLDLYQLIYNRLLQMNNQSNKQVPNNTRNQNALSPHEKMMVKTDYRNPSSQLKSWEVNSPDQLSATDFKKTASKFNQDLSNVRNHTYNTNNTQKSSSHQISSSYKEPVKEPVKTPKKPETRPKSPEGDQDEDLTTYVDEKLVLQVQMDKYKESQRERSKKLKEAESLDLGEKYFGTSPHDEYLDPNERKAEQDYQTVKADYKNQKLKHFLRQNNDAKAKIDEIVDQFDDPDKIVEYHEELERSEKQDFKQKLKDGSKMFSNQRNEPISAILSAKSETDTQEEMYEEMRKSEMGSPSLLREDQNKQPLSVQNTQRQLLSSVTTPRSQFQQATRTIKNFKNEIGQSEQTRTITSEEQEHENEALQQLLSQVIEFLCDDCLHKFDQIKNEQSPVNQLDLEKRQTVVQRVPPSFGEQKRQLSVANDVSRRTSIAAMSPASRQATSQKGQRTSKSYGVKAGSNEKLSRKSQIISVLHSSLKQRVEDEKDKLKVPLEYQMKFMANQDKTPGARIAEVSEECSSSEQSSLQGDVKALAKTQKNKNLKEAAQQSEIRVAYLEAQLEKMEIFYINQMKESGIKMQVRMRKYAHSCLEQVRKQFKDEMHLLFAELELLKNKEIELNDKCERLLKQEAAHQEEILELKSYALWDEAEHKVYTEELEKAGVTPDDLEAVNEESQVLRKSFGPKTYYKSILEQGDLEKDAVNLAKPFKLYNGTLELSITERLNVLERETVRLFQKKLAQCEQFGYVPTDASGGGGGKVGPNGQKDGSIVDIMTNDKVRLENNIKNLEEELARLKANWKADAEKKNAAYAQMEKELQGQLNQLRHSAESIKEMFLKELLIKDNIIKNTEGMKDMYYRIAKDLKTKLQIPRLHLEFLKTKGTLENFVSAKITGDDEAAKWALLQAGKKEIAGITKVNIQKQYDQVKIDHRKESFNKYNMMSTFKKIAESKRSQTYKDESQSLADSFDQYHSLDSINSRRVPVVHGTVRNFNRVFQTDSKESKLSRVFDINFNEMLRNNSPSRVKGSSRKLPVVGQHLSMRNVSRANSNRDMTLKKINNMKPIKSRLSKLDLAAISQHENLKNLTERTQNIVVASSTTEIKIEDTINAAAPAQVLDKYKMNADSSLDESAEFTQTSHPSDSLKDSSRENSRDVMMSTLQHQSTEKKVKYIKPDIQILDQNNQDKVQTTMKQPFSISQKSQSKIDSQGSQKKTTIITKDSSVRQLNVVDEEKKSQVQLEVTKRTSIKLSQGQMSPEVSIRNSNPGQTSKNDGGRRMSLHSSENPNPLLDEQFNISFNNQKIQALQQKLDGSVFVSELSTDGPTIIRHARVKTFDMASALKQGSERLSIDSQKFSEIKIKQKNDKYAEDIVNQIKMQHQGFSNKKEIHQNIGSKKKSNQANTSNQISTINTSKQLTGRKKDFSDQLQAGGNHLNLLRRINKNHHKKSIACQSSPNRKVQERYSAANESESQNAGKQYFETEKTETDDTPKSRTEQEMALESKYQQPNSKLLLNRISQEVIHQGSDQEFPTQEQTIHQGGYEISSPSIKKKIPIGQGMNQSEHETINVTEDSIQDTGSFYNKPRMTGEQTEQINSRTNNSSSFERTYSHQEGKNPVPPLLIPTKDLLRDNGNYAIARRNRQQPHRQNSDIKEIMSKMKKINQYQSNFQPVIEANEQTPVQTSAKKPLMNSNRIGTEMERIENKQFNNTQYLSQSNQLSTQRGIQGNMMSADQFNGDLDSGEKISVIRSTEFNLKKSSAQAQYNPPTQHKSTGITRNQSVQQQIKTSRFHETQRINNGYFQNQNVSNDGQQNVNFVQSQGKFPPKKGRILQTSQMTHRVSSKAMIKGQAITQNQRPKNTQVLSQARISQPTNLPSVLSPRDAAFKNQRQSMVFSQGKQAFLHTNITQYPMNVLSSTDGKSTHTGGNYEMVRKNNQAFKLLEQFQTPNTQRDLTENKAQKMYQNQVIPPITQKEIEKIQDQIAEVNAIDGAEYKNSQSKLPYVSQKDVDSSPGKIKGFILAKPDTLKRKHEESASNSVRQTIPLMQDSIQSLANSKLSQDEFANFQNTQRRGGAKHQLISQISKLKEVTSARTGQNSSLQD